MGHNWGIYFTFPSVFNLWFSIPTFIYGCDVIIILSFGIFYLHRVLGPLGATLGSYMLKGAQQYPHNLHCQNTQLHIITPPHKRVIVPEHQTRSAIPNIINPRDVLRQRVITIQTGPMCQGTGGPWIPHNGQGQKGSGKRHLPKRPHCSPLPNPSPYDRTLRLRTPDRHLTKNTIPLWSTYLSHTGTPIGTTDNLILEPHISR